MNVNSAELNLLPGLNVHERTDPVDVPFAQYHQLDDAAILRTLRYRRASGGYGVCVRLRNTEGTALLGLDPGDAAVAV